jgi:predicted GNAT family acetyltransferase
MLDVPDLTYYVGWMDNRPVAVATRFTSHRIAGIARVSTVPEYRRRGLGEALTARAVVDARAESCAAAFLLATQMGYRVYERFGFRHVIDYHVWASAADG